MHPLKDIVWINFIHFLKQIVNVAKFFEHNFNSYIEEVIIFTDNGRNLFNERLIPKWKANRRKNLSYLADKKSEIFFTSQILENVGKTIFKIFEKISYYSKIKTVNLKYIDSDFFPALHRILNKSENFIYLIVTKDKDFFHLVNSNTFLYLDRIYGIVTIRELLSKKHNISNEKQLILLLFFYPLIHSLIGDRSDNINPLIKHRGASYWIKVIGEIANIIGEENITFQSHPKWELYNIIASKNFLFREFQNSNNLETIFWKRLSVLDFDITSLFAIRSKHPEIYENLSLNNNISNFVNNLYEKVVDSEVYRLLQNNNYLVEKNSNISSSKEEFEKLLEKLKKEYSRELHDDTISKVINYLT